MKLGIVGDTHGNMAWIVGSLLPWCQVNGITHLVQVGDFGVVWKGAQYPHVLSKLDRKLAEFGVVQLSFLPGNHEDHDELALLREQAYRDDDGFSVVTDRIRYIGRVNSWTWEGRRFAAVGGAPSIDRQWRVREQGSKRTLWWPEEVLSGEEQRAALALGLVDVLLTHDAPTSFPFASSLKVDIESDIGRQFMSSVGRALCPSLWFHGHYHVSAEYGFRHDRGVCEVHALDYDGGPPDRVCSVLDLMG